MICSSEHLGHFDGEISQSEYVINTPEKDFGQTKLEEVELSKPIKDDFDGFYDNEESEDVQLEIGYDTVKGIYNTLE